MLQETPSQPPERASRLRNVAASFAPAVIVLVFGMMTYSGVLREHESTDWVTHTHQVIERAQDMLGRMVDAETGERGFIITGDSAYLEPYFGAAAEVRQGLVDLRRLTADNPAQQIRVDSLAGLIDRRFSALESRVATRRSGAFEQIASARIQLGGGKALMDSVRRGVAALDAEENALLVARDADRAAHALAVRWIIGIGTLFAAAIAILVNLTLTGYGERQAALATQLAAQAKDLEEANEHLQGQAAVLEAQSTELETTNEELLTANEHLEERTREAELANRGKVEFLATMSHELRTPLNAIVGYAELLEAGIRGPVSSAQVDDLKRINRSSTHLLSLINDILNFAKIESGRIEVSVEDVNVRSALANFVPLVAPQIQRKALELTLADCDPALLVRADPEKLDQILLNLVANAIKFTASGGRIAIDCTVADTSVEFHVRDTGRGIAPEHVDSIFEPFVQVGRPRSRENGQGVGLGLAISRELARAMDGELTVTSAVGEGSMFTLRVPRGSG